MNIDNNYKKQELENFIWHLIKDKKQVSYTDNENNQINEKAELLDLKDFEIRDIKDKQLDKLIHFLEEQQKELEQSNQKNIQQEDEKIVEISNKEPIKTTEEIVEISNEKQEPIQEDKKIEIASSDKPKNKWLLPIGVLSLILLIIAGGFFIWNNANRETDFTISQIQPVSNPVVSSEEKEYKFEELVGNYIGKYNGQTISIQLLLENGKERFMIKGESNSTYMVSYPQGYNVINFHKPKRNLGEFKVIKEQNNIILKSETIRLIKLN